MPFYEKGDVRIRYEEAGSGFPLFLVPGGGLNSRISNWPNAVFNSMEIFKGEVCYPQAKQLLITAGCEGSKWNRIEHRLFAFITQNWER
jgi:hypothetical protein